MCSDSTTPSYLVVSGRQAGWLRGKRDLRCSFYHLPWQLLRWRFGWKESYSLLLRLARAGPQLLVISQMPCSRVLRRSVGCYVAVCAWPSQEREKQNQARNKVARHSPLSTAPAGPAGAEEEEHLLLHRDASAFGLHHAIFARLRVSLNLCSQNGLQLDVSLLPRSLWPICPGTAGREGPAPPTLAAAQVDSSLEGHAAAAGSGWSCRQCSECSGPYLSRKFFA